MSHCLSFFCATLCFIGVPKNNTIAIAGCTRGERYISQRASRRPDLNAKPPGAATQPHIRRPRRRRRDHQQRHRHAGAQSDI